MEAITAVLRAFGIDRDYTVRPVYQTAWSVGDAYILKQSGDLAKLQQSAGLCQWLLPQRLPAAEYLKTAEGRPYVFYEGACYCLMKKIHGVHMDPYTGDWAKNGETLGRFTARLHNALGGADCPAAFYEVNPAAEFSGWILPALRESGIALEEAILEDCEAFLPLYARLPSQLIHRDLHLGNLLFQNGEVAGIIDFDIAQKNARLFDLCYLGASLLVGNYTNDERLLPWRAIIAGILNGYTETTPLTRDEKTALPMLFVYIELLFTGFFAKAGQIDAARSCASMTGWLYRNRNTWLCFAENEKGKWQ